MMFVDVIYHREPDAWWAESPALEGWTATAETLRDLDALVDEGVRFALDRDDVEIMRHFERSARQPADITFDFVRGETTVVRPAGADRQHLTHRADLWAQPA